MTEGLAATRDVVLLGSTGSIGTQALDVVRRNPGRFRVVGVGASGSSPASIELLAAQALEFGVEAVAISRAPAAQDVLSAFYAVAREKGFSAGEFAVPKLLVGPQAAAELAGWPCDVVLNGITGSIGLAPTLAALQAGRILALANKESLIVGGPLVKDLAAPGQIVPVDSEHSALAQCLYGWRKEDVRRLVLTASGGPFRGWTQDQLLDITPDQALAHPTWRMGPVITVNSATLVNKGLELIEAHLLFDLPLDRITVVVHPQSVVHSMVEFVDGSTLLQASPPDMRLPIAWALAWPERLADVAPGCDWSSPTSWEFEPLDSQTFPAVSLARSAAAAGGTAPAVYNAANEECVGAFLKGRLRFVDIVPTVEAVLGAYSDQGTGGNRLTLDDVLSAEEWARAQAQRILT